MGAAAGWSFSNRRSFLCVYGAATFSRGYSTDSSFSERPPADHFPIEALFLLSIKQEHFWERPPADHFQIEALFSVNERGDR